MHIDKASTEFESHKDKECPFIHSLVSGCHCTEMKSTRIEDAIYYCGANYRKCEIYKMIKTGGKDIKFPTDSVCMGKV